jgi:hypothetical protein
MPLGLHVKVRHDWNYFWRFFCDLDPNYLFLYPDLTKQ